MALNFPINPVDGQVYTSGTLSYQWKISTNTWVSVDSISPIAIAAFDKANIANITASAAFAKANGSAQLSFGTVVANGTSLVADSNNDTLTILTTGNVAIVGNATGDNLTFDLTTTGVTAGIYGSSTIVPVFTVDSRGRITSVTNTTIDTTIATAAFSKANGAAQLAFGTIIANGTSLVADSNNDTLTIRTTGNVAITADAAGDNLTFDLTTTGVTAATYGSSTIVPVFVVDSRGRLTSVTNTTIDTSIATAAFAKANGAAQNTFTTVVANGTSLIADGNNDTLTIRTTGNVSITADAAGDNLTFDLTTTGVTAATYGSSTIVPVFTVDSRGRITSVTNTTISATADLSSVVLKTGNTMTGNLVMSGANIAFATATNSGIYWSGTSFIHSPAANTLVIGTSNAEDVRIDASGNVGIGINPQSKLHVFTSSDEVARFQSSGNPYIGLYDSTSNLVGYMFSTSGNTEFASAAGRNLRITSGGSYNTTFITNSTERMRITSGGNVGIGETSPSAKLHVSGNITASAIDVGGINVAPAISSTVMKSGNTMTGNLVMSGANIAFATATNSGIYWGGTSFIHSPAANTISIGIASSQVIEINSSGNVSLFDSIFERPTIKDYSLARVDLGNATGSVTIDLQLGNFFTATSTGTTTWTFSNPPTGARSGGFILELTNGGSQTQNWPTSNTKWPGGTAPTLTTSGVDILVFITDDGGTTWRGVASMIDSK